MLNTTSYMSLSWEKAVQWARETPAMQGLVEICYYDDPIEAAAERFLRSEEWPAILSLLRIEPGDQVLEIGGGRGIISWALAKAGCEVTVLEPDPSPLVGSGAIRSLCQATSVPLTIVEDWGERLPFAEMQFDKVICRAVLHHARDLPDMCREIHRVLCPGGRFLAIKDHVVDDTTQLEQFLLNHPLHHLYGGEHAFSFSGYVTALRGAGFNKIKHYGPFDHEISWSPQFSLASIRSSLVLTLAKRLPTGLAKLLGDWNSMARLYGWWLSKRSKVPGRLFSFLATKK